MIPSLKAALKASLEQEDEAVRARLGEAPPPAKKAARPAKPAKAPKVARSHTRIPADGEAGAATPAGPEAKMPVAAPPVKAEPSSLVQKPEKLCEQSFNLAESDTSSLKNLKESLRREGRVVTRSELVRVGIRLLSALDTAELTASVQALPPAKNKKK